MGLSTEGYQIASALTSKKVPTYIIDENLQMGMELKPEIVRGAPNIHSFMEGEPLVGLQPMTKALSEAKYIFLTPKIRRTGESGKTEILTRIRDVAKTLSKDATLVVALPMGVGQNAQALLTIEKLSGLTEGRDFRYIYAPLKPRTTLAYTLGQTQPKIDKDIATIFGHAALKAPAPLSLDSSEVYLGKQLVSRYSELTADLELYGRIGDKYELGRLVKQSSYSERYLDDLVDNYLDLRGLSETLETGDPLLYLVSGVLKSVESYVRRVTDAVRGIFKEKMLKASKTRIILAWSLDPYEIRGDRHIFIGSLLERLRDFVGDVTTFRSRPYPEGEKVSITPELALDKTNLVIFCSKQDYEASSSDLDRRNFQSDVILLKANLLFEIVD